MCLLAACAGLACGEDLREPDLSVTATAAWNDAPASAQELGYQVTVHVVQMPRGGRCQALIPHARILVNDVEAPFTTDRVSGCVEATRVIGPAIPMLPSPDVYVAVRAEVHGGDDPAIEGRHFASATFSGLVPGSITNIASPLLDQIRAGSDLVIYWPSSLPASAPGAVRFYPLDASPWPPSGLDGVAPPTLQGDRIHLTVPTFSGRAAVVVRGTADPPAPAFTCPGFATCAATAAATVGPVFFTVQP